MTRQFLLDTDTCIAAMRLHPMVVGKMTSLAPSQCHVSSISAYELFTGMEKCAKPQMEAAKIAALLQAVLTLPFEENSARHAAGIRADLEAKGLMIGPYDVLLAGQALAHGLVLVTHNVGEFQRVSGLTLEDWQSATP